MSSSRGLVVGVGNALRGDDAVGLVVARRIREENRELAVFESDGEASRLLDAWQGSDRVVVIDAMLSGAAPGTVVEFDVSHGPLPSTFGGTSTHALGLVEAVELGRALGALPRRLIVVGVEGATFALGAAMSSDVERSLDEAVVRVRAALEV